MQRICRLGLGLLAGLLAVCVLSPAASGSLPASLWQAPEAGIEGSGAGALRVPQGVATDEITGDVFVADRDNARIAQFDVWGRFVRAWGWGVVDGEPEFQICTVATGCQRGSEGAGPGQVAQPRGIAVDQTGNVYVNEVVAESQFFGEPSFRVQKFDSEGNFLLMWGGEVNKTTGANVCTKADVEGGDVCGAGVPGTEDGWFAQTFSGGSRLAIGPTGSIFVGDVGRIQEFSPTGQFLADVAVPGETVHSLAVNSLGQFYVTYYLPSSAPFIKPDVHRLSATGSPIETLAVVSPRALAVSGDDHLWAVEQPTSTASTLIEFDSSGDRLIGPEEHFAETYLLGGIAIGSGCDNPGEAVYVTRIGFFAAERETSLAAYGSPPDATLCPPPAKAPTIASQFATSVDPEGATLQAKINPHFWPDARYYVEYGTGKCSEGGCASTAPAPPGSLLTSSVVNAEVKSAGVFLAGLEPQTAYRYRFVAQSGGGGPVSGVEGAEGTFTTRALPAAQPSCPNDPLRTGPSALLPDCRAYEMVSPLDKEGGDIYISGKSSFHNQAAEEGSGLAYTSYRSFGDPEGAPNGSEYLARRGEAGWESEAVSPPRGANLLDAQQALLQQFKVFSDDLCRAWLWNDTDSLLAPDAAPGYTTIYRRENCAGEANPFTALGPLATAAPKYREAKKFVPEMQGVSEDGEHALFRVSDRLTDSGPDLGTGKQLLYEAYGEGQLRAVCILPGGALAPNGCSAGTASGDADNSTAHAVANAISADGSTIFWSDSPFGAGKLYARIGGAQTKQITTEAAQFWAAAADGSKALYTIGGLGSVSSAATATLYEYDLAKGASTPVLAKVRGLLGASEDAETIYLVSEEGLDGAAAGEPNLYRREAGGGFEFIAELSSVDATAKLPGGYAYSAANVEPRLHTARVSPDGAHLAFTSDSPELAAQTAGADNTDVASEAPALEVYHYSAQSGQLVCASCDPSGARAVGRQLTTVNNSPSVQWAAALLAPAQNQLYASRALSADGARLYFQSYGPLVAADTNGLADVYQWEAVGAGTCAVGAPGYSAANGGCLSLISSGKSSSDSRFLDASADGADVFFATAQSLLPQDPGLVDVYDAREGGGYPAPPEPEPVCQGEACQGPVSAPRDPTPASSTYRGPGNARPTPQRPRCPKGKHRAKKGKKRGKCVKPKSRARSQARHRRASRPDRGA